MIEHTWKINVFGRDNYILLNLVATAQSDEQDNQFGYKTQLVARHEIFTSGIFDRFPQQSPLSMIFSMSCDL